MSHAQPPGSIGWIDLTVPNAEEVRAFYEAVVGWSSEPVSMGDYNDYCMKPPGGEPVAGVCHARSMNADLPPQWLMYIIVTDLDESVRQVQGSGGSIIAGPKGEPGKDRYCVIRDPAGAVAALYQPAR